MNDLIFKFEENGENYKIIKILKAKDLPYTYIIYTSDKINLYASRYELIDNKIVLFPVEEEAEWNYIDQKLEEVLHGN